jgi:restriction endonuclease S subunit
MKKYDNYKDSGVEWIGEIPEHWDTTKMKFFLTIQSGKGITNEKFVEDGEYNIYGGNGILGQTDKHSHDGLDLIIGRVGALCGNVRLVDGKKWISDNALLANTNQNYSFMETCLTVLDLNKLANKNAQPLITGTMVKEQYFALPPISEQTAIANYLDQKTTQIDQLINQKKRFIELLQEERTAVINQAVTKGLDPTVKMKDSGIEWLGEIPEHWEVKRLRNLVETIKTGSTPPSEEIQYFEPQEINWYGPGDFDSLILGDSKRKISQFAIKENKCKLFPPNSLLLIGIGATVGKIGIVSEACSSNQQINAIILLNNYNPKFYLYFLSTIKDIIVMEASSATLPIFNQTQTKNIITPVPPLQEQIEISSFIENEEFRIQTIISKSQQEIELLKEYKTALISEVVTGKVDVRDLVLN